MSDTKMTFAVLAEKRGYDRPLYMHDLSFDRLMEDVIVPYGDKKRFFIDGVPLTAEELMRIKVLQEDEEFKVEFIQLHHFLTKPTLGMVEAEDYPTRLDAIFRAYGEDVTSRILNAYEKGIGPRVKEYLANVATRPEIIKGALELFLSGVKYLG